MVFYKKAPKRTFFSPNHPPSPCIQWLRPCISYLKKKQSTIVTLFKNQMNQMKNIANVFYNPSSTPDAISQADEKMFLAIYKSPANGHNLNNYRYAAFLKSSTKTKVDLSSTKGAALQHSFSNVCVCSTCHGLCTNGAAPLEEEEFEFEQIEKYDKIRLRTRVKTGYVYFYEGYIYI
ncbi:hypothetical protein AVEN_38096-1 [Araneus ventricosus]|uniref:Uncharacterized protein n=1 Tax=Araneus ventricosus TaxID=182803 RepID=A0A4Y2G6T9_ARAVE|nr:hypothetical protein AVEN_38096-1 [Araneus ventricosus]